MKFIDESIYCNGTGRTYNYLNRLLHEVLSYEQTIILKNFFCEDKNLPTAGRITQKIIPYFIK